MANEERDNRLDQIKEGAGLEDSRINQEFVDFVRKWSTPVLLVAALIALGYFYNNKRKESRAAHIDQAFQELNASTETGSPSPDALRRIAQDYDNVPGVRALANLTAADEYLRAVQRGVKPGTPINPNTGEYESPDDAITPDDRTRFFNEAEALYKQVFSDTEDKPGMAIHALSALYGLAAVSESRGDTDAAKNMLDRASTLAEKHGFLEHNTIAKMRLTALPDLMSQTITPISKSELPVPPAPEPEPVVAPDAGETGPQLPEGGAPAVESGGEEGQPAGEAQGGDGAGGDAGGESDGSGG
jgi:hypothetical protein